MKNISRIHILPSSKWGWSSWFWCLNFSLIFFCFCPALIPPPSSCFYFLLPILAMSSALAAALVLMSWFFARSMRTLRMLVGTSKERAKRVPCWTLLGAREAGRGALACLSTRRCSERSSEFNKLSRFRMLIARTSLCGSSSCWVRSGRLIWVLTQQGSKRTRQKHTRTLHMVTTACNEKNDQDYIFKIFPLFFPWKCLFSLVYFYNIISISKFDLLCILGKNLAHQYFLPLNLKYAE